MLIYAKHNIMIKFFDFLSLQYLNIKYKIQNKIFLFNIKKAI